MGLSSVKNIICTEGEKIQFLVSNYLFCFRSQPSIGQSVSHDLLLGRWRLALDLFGRVFMEDVGLEPGSVVSELGGFAVKEAKFRREMEKLRNAQQRDLTLSKVLPTTCLLLSQNFIFFYFAHFLSIEYYYYYLFQ